MQTKDQDIADAILAMAKLSPQEIRTVLYVVRRMAIKPVRTAASEVNAEANLRKPYTDEENEYLQNIAMLTDGITKERLRQKIDKAAQAMRRSPKAIREQIRVLKNRMAK